MKRLYVNCPICGITFPSGFCVESPVQLIDLSYLCPKCRSIVPCDPPEYLEKVGEEFKRAMKNEEVFTLPLSFKRVELSGPEVFELTSEVKVEEGRLLVSDKAIVRFKEKNSNGNQSP